MSDEIIFFHNPMSRGRIAHYMLEEVGVPYHIELIDFERREHKTADYLAINPMGKVPTIVHNGLVVTEAAAICTYLADAFPEAKLAPALDDPARGTYLRWLFFGAGCVEPALVDRLLKRPIAEPQSALGYGSYEDMVATLEKALAGGPFLLGERFTAADVYIASQIAWGFMGKSLEPRPRFQRYLERVSARPAYERMTHQNNELVEDMKNTKPGGPRQRIKSLVKITPPADGNDAEASSATSH
jgi:glutathione S-transferase